VKNKLFGCLIILFPIMNYFAASYLQSGRNILKVHFCNIIFISHFNLRNFLTVEPFIEVKKKRGVNYERFQ